MYVVALMAIHISVLDLWQLLNTEPVKFGSSISDTCFRLSYVLRHICRLLVAK